ncbi:MAG: oligopeptide transporter, family, partial [Phenylobacterium sp.]|nr:oligopeptide transporter, family [Phenylobacterium sp.]
GIAFSAGVLGNFDRDVTKLMESVNPFFAGPHADLLSILPFLGLMALLFRAGARKPG